MHKSSMIVMEWFVRTYLDSDEKLRVLDVGSYDINGTYRQLFVDKKFEYIGLDMATGPNVDIVPQNIYNWKEIADNTYDVVVSGQAFEHIEFFWITAAEMARVLKYGGIMCIIAPRGRPRHRHPVDCYRFDADGMIAIARYCNLHILHCSTAVAPKGAPKDWNCPGNEDSFLVACKPFDWHGCIDVSQYKFMESPMLAMERSISKKTF